MSGEELNAVTPRWSGWSTPTEAHVRRQHHRIETKLSELERLEREHAEVMFQ